VELDGSDQIWESSPRVSREVAGNGGLAVLRAGGRRFRCSGGSFWRWMGRRGSEKLGGDASRGGISFAFP
jgi:hypothetical protein